MCPPDLLQMRKIRKTFPGAVALDNVDFDLRKGEVHVLLGENGAGKSTLMKILSGAYAKPEGRILLEGEEIEIHTPRHAQELGISTIYQELNLVPHLTAAENVFLGREPQWLPGILHQARLNRQARTLLDKVGAKIRATAPVRELGVGQQQMVEVAKALAFDAKIVIMDEPTSALTEPEIRQLFAVIRRLKARGVSIIYISHRLEELFEIGDRVTVLRDGKYIGTLNTVDTTRADLIRMMAGRELREHFPKQPVDLGEEILRVKNLSRAGILRDVSFSLRRGEIVGIAGLMGSGRTELARAIFGADKPDTGDIVIHGAERAIKSPRHAIRAGLAFLTEDRKSQGLILTLSVAENISLATLPSFSRFGFLLRNRERQAAQRYIQELRIKTPGPARRVRLLSGGNQQKVVLSKWLCCHADIFIFDEPTRGIDVGAKVEIYQLINSLIARGAAIIMISSELPEIIGMSDRILVMHRGRIAAKLSAAGATQDRILSYALGDSDSTLSK